MWYLWFPSFIRDWPLWRLYLLLLCEEFCSLVSTNIDTFIETNNTKLYRSPYFVKAFLKGHIIYYTWHANKERKKEMQALSQSISLLDRQYSMHPL